MKLKKLLWMPAFLCILVFAPTGLLAPQTVGPSRHSSVGVRSSTYDRVIHLRMQNVLFRVMDNVVFQIASLDGVVMPSRRNATVSLDDKNSFSLNMRTATTSISSVDLAALANGFIVPRAQTPLKNLKLVFNPDQSISVKGDFHKVVDVPFSATATVHVTADGNIRMHFANMTVAGVLHQDLLDALGIKISKVAQPKRKQSFQIVGNDIIFPIDQMFPPPHVSGHLRDVNISGDQLDLVFGSDKQHEDNGQSHAEYPPVSAGSYVYFRGGTMKFALLTMTPVDLELVPLKPDREKLFEFSVDKYYRQLVAGYSKSLPNKGLLVYMADYRDIRQATQAAQK
ncbi:MAG: hypothetical protein ACYCOR_13780 [Acidobacteriaceae bacterium]